MKERAWKRHKCFGMSDEIYRENQNFFLNFFTREKDNPKFLDTGCSDGKFTLKIAKVIGTNRCFGIEMNKRTAKAASRKNIKIKISDLNYAFPYPNGFFDIISANQVLEHLWNTPNFFKEANRTLKMGGYAVISVPNLSSFHSIFFILLGQQTPVIHLIDRQVGNFLKGTKISWPGHLKAFNVPALKDLAHVYGFKIEKIEGFGIYFLPFFLQKMMSKILTRYSVFLTMRIKKIKKC